MKLGDKIKKLFGLPVIEDHVWDDLVDMLIESDLSPAYAMQLGDTLRKSIKKSGDLSIDSIKRSLAAMMKIDLLSAKLPPAGPELEVVMLLGVNGVGKTSTAAKLAHYFQKQSESGTVILAAADTFRAAAIEQLKIHGQRLGARVVAQEHGSDAGAVIYDALQAATTAHANLLVADTAGRMHNKLNLVRELEKIDKIITARVKPANYRKLLVLDATTGTNALRQAEIFSEAVRIDGIIMTKLDSTARGGMLATICRELKLPVFFVCDGESYANIQPFDADSYLQGLLDL
ncbi:MAG: signal recognition particle-docking protein FtsY [Spirochaetes bacterium GWD1_61_31]|nr:MAG: signal recognition particle-docking protein FtsY [Spirochaetes bacterium GWB1_60_80]OHD29572.1 MAG: signal recognition particle-docking protein FtsY [Spirochaetes bacterium GWC1_61_12]OHD37477.1 MAG: signal recognition particle-docking protein FtsY [Spirochaetes bacterium GWD1_61_31]OHD42014.1 MAG: signal recognition particle-docking protein FtsY [Spirochaetes bacterium GWE1_60_18]OHD61719.1 MAG: signal recognition particle-docking protein FtsY [Spirochaetes bacterium GWF1_60_12]